MKNLIRIKRIQKSVQSIHQCKSLIQIMNDIVNAQGGEIKVEILPPGKLVKEDVDAVFII